MSAAFPFAAPFARIDNVLWRVFHCRGDKTLATKLTSLWELWSLHPTLQRRVVASRSALLKVVVARVLQAIRVHSNSVLNLPLDQLYTLLQLLRSVASQSVLLQRFSKQLDASGDIERVQQRFSEFTSGSKLCIELIDILACPLVDSQEFAIDGLDLRALQDRSAGLAAADDGTSSIASVITTHSVASAKYSVAKSAAGFEPKRAHYQSAIAKDIIQEDGDRTTNEKKFKLKTLGEHRYATRFQKKRVTAKTWHSALREAHKLIRSGDRVKVADALYLLLEIIWLDPPGSKLATLYLDAGSIYLGFDHLDEGAKAYRNSLRLDSSSWKARFNLGVTLARLEDFIEATRQLKLALASCPKDIAVEIGSMMEEIGRIQQSKNLRAYNQTKKARMFTTQYMELLHQVSDTSWMEETPLQEDHTLSHRSGLALASATPQLLDASQSWKGAVASLLHRLNAFAWYHHFDVRDEMLRLDPTRMDGISVQAFGDVLARVTGVPLRVTERKELARLVGNDGTIIFHFLAPNAETVSAIDEMRRLGACHSLLEWSLFRKRAKRSPMSRAGGLWYWFDITMEKWVKLVLPASHDHTISSLVKALANHGWVTPMDFAWNRRCLPGPDDFPILQLADRGTFIYECHRARSQIQDEAQRMLQMFARRVLIATKHCTTSMFRGQHASHAAGPRDTHFLEDVHTRLARDTMFDQNVMRDVLQCIEDIVDDLVVAIRQDQKSYEDEVAEVCLQEIPVRTEQRHKSYL